MTNQTNISHWLHSIQYPYGTYEKMSSIDDYTLRIWDIRKKINSMLDIWFHSVSTSKSKLNFGNMNTWDIMDIRDAIGVYGIYHCDDPRRVIAPSNVLWYQVDRPSNDSRPYIEKKNFNGKDFVVRKQGKEWIDYFGDDKIIIDRGGWVIVSLSDEGIEYLNEIADKVASVVTTE